MALKTSHALPDPCVYPMFSCPMPHKNLQVTFITDWFLAQTVISRRSFACHLASTLGTTDLRDAMSCPPNSGTSSLCTRTARCARRKSQTVLFHYDCSATVQVVYPAKSSGSAAFFLMWQTPAKGFKKTRIRQWVMRHSSGEHSDKCCWNDTHGE